MFSQVFVCPRRGVSQHAPGQGVWYRGGVIPGAPPPPKWPLSRSVRILLECILVTSKVCSVNCWNFNLSKNCSYCASAIYLSQLMDCMGFCVIVAIAPSGTCIESLMKLLSLVHRTHLLRCQLRPCHKCTMLRFIGGSLESP